MILTFVSFIFSYHCCLKCVWMMTYVREMGYDVISCTAMVGDTWWMFFMSWMLYVEHTDSQKIRKGVWWSTPTAINIWWDIAPFCSSGLCNNGVVLISTNWGDCCCVRLLWRIRQWPSSYPIIGCITITVVACHHCYQDDLLLVLLLHSYQRLLKAAKGNLLPDLPFSNCLILACTILSNNAVVCYANLTRIVLFLSKCYSCLAKMYAVMGNKYCPASYATKTLDIHAQ